MLVAVAALWLALAIDALFGEPPARWHPVVWMGRYLGWAGRHVAPMAGAPAQRSKPFFIAALAWWIGAAVVLVAALAVSALMARLPALLAAVLLAIALKPLLAWRMLRDEVQAVEAALESSLEAGREHGARLVSRDVRQLRAAEVRQSAI